MRNHAGLLDGRTFHAYLHPAQRDWTASMDDIARHDNIEISNTAINMISTMHRGDDVRVADTIAQVIADVKDDANVKRLGSYPDVFVVRGRGLRVIYRKGGGKTYVTTVANDA